MAGKAKSRNKIVYNSNYTQNLIDRNSTSAQPKKKLQLNQTFQGKMSLNVMNIDDGDEKVSLNTGGNGKNSPGI